MGLRQADEQSSAMRFFILLLAVGAYAAPEAEAEAEADPAVLYSSYYGYPYGLGYGYGLGGYYGYSPYAYTHGYYAHVKASPGGVYTVHGGYPYRYYANSAGVVHAVKKREAEADPEAWYYGYYGRRWGGWGGYYGHRYGYYGYPRYVNLEIQNFKSRGFSTGHSLCTARKVNKALFFTPCTA